MQQNVALRQT